MQTRGLLLVFESAPKCGKTTLSAELAGALRQSSLGQAVMLGRCALSNSEFATTVKSRNITDLGYSTAFYWADLIFYAHDVLSPHLAKGGIIVQDRYDLSIVCHREVYGLSDDEILLDGYLQRGMIPCPDLTIFLNPPWEVICNRIKSDPKGSPIDKEFLEVPSRIGAIQERIQYHLSRLDRQFVVLDTAALTIQESIRCILGRLQITI